MGTEENGQFAFPTSCVSAAERVRYCYRVNRKLTQQHNELMPGLKSSAEQRGFKKDWRCRLHQLGRILVPLREEAIGIRDDDDGPPVLKLEGYAEKKWDSFIKAAPIMAVHVEPLAGFDPYEDFLNDYTEVDPNTRINVVPYIITATAIQRDEDAYAYRDAGAGHFAGDFTHLFVARTFGTNDGNSGCATYHTATNVDDYYNGLNGAGAGLTVAGGPTLYWNVRHKEATVTQDDDTSLQIADATHYYFTYDRSGSSISCTIRTVSHGGAVFDTLLMDDDGDPRRYVFGVSSRNQGVAVRNSVEVWQLDLQEGIAILRRRIEGE